MTTGDLLRAMVVRWYITLVGVLLTALAVLAVRGTPGVYETSVDVQFLPPSTFVRTANNNPDNDLVAMAGLVEAELNRDGERLQPASPDVPLSGMGVRTGTMVVLPNEDGQFDFTFREPLLRVKAVGASAEQAEDLRDQRVREIRDVLERLQVNDGVPARDRMGTRLVPAVPPVAAVGGATDRAAAVTGMLGLLLTGAACVLGDRFLVSHRWRARSRWRRRAREGSGRATTS